MTKKRCAWCLSDPIYISYHDNEWGKTICDDNALFACLCLEIMQAGLNWITILKKRENFYHAFDNFNPQLIARYDDNKVHELMQNSGIIRHRVKIHAIINNAQAYLKILQNETFYAYIYRTINQYGNFPRDNHPVNQNDIPAYTKPSQALARQLKRDGFKFIGATTCYAFMQATGFVNDHLIDCAFRHSKI